MKSFARIAVASLAFATSLVFSNAASADEPAVVIVSGAAPLRSATVIVHIDAPENVVLEQQVDKRTFRVVCDAPCDRELPLDATYRVHGDSIRNSALIRLQGKPGERVVLTVDPSAKGTFTAGIALTSVGGALLVGSLLYGMVAGMGNIRWCDGECSDAVRADRHERAVEIERNMAIMAGVGGAGTVAGLVLMLSNRQSGVEQDRASTNAAFVRTPPRPERETLPVQGATFVLPATFQF